MNKYIVIFALILVQACSGGGTTPTDPDTVFQFSTGSLIPGDKVNGSITGTDTRGGKYTGSIAGVVQSQTTFLGQPAIPIYEQIQLNNTTNGASVSIVATAYYSTSENDRRLLGVSSPQTTTTVSATTTALPQTVKIGDLGNIGTYTDNTGNITVESWRVTDGGNGRANIIITASYSRQSGGLISTSIVTSLIDTSGNVLSSKMKLSDVASGVTINLNLDLDATTTVPTSGAVTVTW